jgi:ketosteroid isomerase-like protein
MSPGPQQEYVAKDSQSALVSHAFASSGSRPASVRHASVGLCPADPPEPPVGEPLEPPALEPPEPGAPPVPATAPSDLVSASVRPLLQAQASSSDNDSLEAPVGLMSGRGAMAVPGELHSSFAHQRRFRVMRRHASRGSGCVRVAQVGTRQRRRRSDPRRLTTNRAQSAPNDVVRRFNDAINARDLDRLSSLMTEDHRFIDSAGSIVDGKPSCIDAWRRFFDAFPDYCNEFDHLEAYDDVVTVRGRSHGSVPALDGSARWTARVEGERVAEWRVHEA